MPKRALRITPSAGYLDMTQIPIPAWHKIDHRLFQFHQIQTTRGCPFVCRFCSVPDISGNEFRFKPIEQIIAEINALPRGNWKTRALKTLYIVDDNFLSKAKFTKNLLKALVPLHKKGILMEWSAETTINVCLDKVSPATQTKVLV